MVLVHVHFNNALQPMMELAKIGYINPKCIISFHGYDAYLFTIKNEFQKKYGAIFIKNTL